MESQPLGHQGRPLTSFLTSIQISRFPRSSSFPEGIFSSEDHRYIPQSIRPSSSGCLYYSRGRIKSNMFLHIWNSCLKCKLVCLLIYVSTRFPGGSVAKKLPANAGDKRNAGSVPGLGRSLVEGNDIPLQYSCLGNPMDRRAWQAAVHGIAKESDRTEWLNNNNTCFYKPLFHTLRLRTDKKEWDEFQVRSSGWLPFFILSRKGLCCCCCCC